MADVERFVDAVRRVADGGSALDPEVVAHLLGPAPPRRPARRSSPPREREVLGADGGGRSNKAIAEQLVVTERAVEKHVTGIFDKLGLEPAPRRPPPRPRRPDLPRQDAVTPRQSLARLEALAEEQAALRRVATLAARDPDPGALFECVCEELGRLLGVESTDMLRFKDDDTATVVGVWSAEGAPSVPVGETDPVDGDS